jgi:hypothetical protein
MLAVVFEHAIGIGFGPIPNASVSSLFQCHMNPFPVDILGGLTGL